MKSGEGRRGSERDCRSGFEIGNRDGRSRRAVGRAEKEDLEGRREEFDSFTAETSLGNNGSFKVGSI